MAILIVDDNQVNLFVIEKILKGAGYTDYHSFTSARELFKYLKVSDEHAQLPPADVILMDIMMPEMDGIEACKYLQKIAHLKDIPVIFVTALEDSQKVAEALDVGGVDYITKPINKIELLARLRVALRLKEEKDWHTEQELKIRNELDLATQVQRTLLSEPIFTDHIHIAASYIPAYKLAGDLYYWHKIDEDRYAVILLDMMGHGISASLVCMFISSVLRDAIRKHTDPESVITELNRWMAYIAKDDSYLHYYFTAIYLVVDTNKKTVTYVNAGHPPGFACVDGKDLITLERGSLAVGFTEHIKVNATTLHYENSIQLLLYTDGVEEALERTGRDPIAYLQNATSQYWNPLASNSPIDMILSKDLQYNQPDDMCTVMIRVQS